MKYYLKSLTGYWPTARALSKDAVSAFWLLLMLLSIPVRKRLFGRTPKRLRLHLNGRSFNWYVRDGNDISALRELFADKEYAFDGLPAVAERIADVGAHIGTASLYFHLKYPEAQLTSYEPDPENFKVLQINLHNIPRTKCINTAVSDVHGTVTFYTNSSGSTRASTIRQYDSKGKVTVASVTFDEVVGTGCDLMKFDIEGGEKRMFSAASPRTLQSVGCYVGEVHHNMIGMSRDEFEKLLPGRTFDWKDRGAGLSIVAIK